MDPNRKTKTGTPSKQPLILAGPSGSRIPTNSADPRAMNLTAAPPRKQQQGAPRTAPPMLPYGSTASIFNTNFPMPPNATKQQPQSSTIPPILPFTGGQLLPAASNRQQPAFPSHTQQLTMAASGYIQRLMQQQQQQQQQPPPLPSSSLYAQLPLSLRPRSPSLLDPKLYPEFTVPQSSAGAQVIYIIKDEHNSNDRPEPVSIQRGKRKKKQKKGDMYLKSDSEEGDGEEEEKVKKVKPKQEKKQLTPEEREFQQIRKNALMREIALAVVLLMIVFVPIIIAVTGSTLKKGQTNKELKAYCTQVACNFNNDIQHKEDRKLGETASMASAPDVMSIMPLELRQYARQTKLRALGMLMLEFDGSAGAVDKMEQILKRYEGPPVLIRDQNISILRPGAFPCPSPAASSPGPVPGSPPEQLYGSLLHSFPAQESSSQNTDGGMNYGLYGDDGDGDGDEGPGPPLDGGLEHSLGIETGSDEDSSDGSSEGRDDECYGVGFEKHGQQNGKSGTLLNQLQEEYLGRGEFAADVVGAWEYTTGNPEIVVAVLLSGVDLHHPALLNRMWRNSRESASNGFDDDRNGYVDDHYGWNFVDDSNDVQDTSGWGTYVASIVAGEQGRSSGAPMSNGIADIRIMPLVVFTSSKDASLFGLIKALEYAVANGAHIIFMPAVSEAQHLSGSNLHSTSQLTWHTHTIAKALTAAAAGLRKKGVMLVTEAGTQHPQGGDLDSEAAKGWLKIPCTIPETNIICVGHAATRSGGILNSSNFGNISVDMLAPATRICGAQLGHKKDVCLCGSLTAGPIATGVAALVLSVLGPISDNKFHDVWRAARDAIVVSSDAGHVNSTAAVTAALHRNYDTFLPSEASSTAPTPSQLRGFVLEDCYEQSNFTTDSDFLGPPVSSLIKEAFNSSGTQLRASDVVRYSGWLHLAAPGPYSVKFEYDASKRMALKVGGRRLELKRDTVWASTSMVAASAGLYPFELILEQPGPTSRLSWSWLTVGSSQHTVQPDMFYASTGSQVQRS